MKKENYTFKDRFIKIVLLIIIIILLFHNCSLLKLIKEKDKIKKPTGNVDIFEIMCNKDNCEKKDNTKPSKPVSKSNTANTMKEVEKEKELTISDKNIIWKSNNKLRIFSNPVYNMDSIIAPEDSNTYQFVIKNNTDYNIQYGIKFIEKNPYNINMKYKLRKGNDYMIDDYVDYNELNQSNIILNMNNNDTYYLEWKWIGSNDDTELANLENAYDLSIEIEAESIYE